MLKKKIGKEKIKIQPPPLRPHLTLTLLLEFLKKREEHKKGKQKISSFLFLLLVLCPLSVVRSPVFSQSPQVPHLINFQSVVTDATGSPLSDGMRRMIFRVVDAKGAESYKETQNLESVHGVVSAMVGSHGELNLSMFDPKIPKFLGVQVEGSGPETLLEIASVPYAMTAEQTLSVAPQSITAEAIKPKAITADLLADDVVQQLLTRLQTGGAGQIGVSNTFVYSQGTTMEGVIKDLDTAVYQRQVNMDRFRSDLNNSISQETSARSQADTNLQNQISTANTSITSLQDQTNALNTSVSASESDTASRLGTLERSVDQLSAPPKVAAMGVVTYSGSNSSPSLSGSYNFSGFYACTVSFSTPIATPYVVQITPRDLGLPKPLSARNINASGFDVKYGDAGDPGCIQTSFNFAVFK